MKLDNLDIVEVISVLASLTEAKLRCIVIYSSGRYLNDLLIGQSVKRCYVFTVLRFCYFCPQQWRLLWHLHK